MEGRMEKREESHLEKREGVRANQEERKISKEGCYV